MDLSLELRECPCPLTLFPGPAGNVSLVVTMVSVSLPNLLSWPESRYLPGFFRAPEPLFPAGRHAQTAALLSAHDG